MTTGATDRVLAAKLHSANADIVTAMRLVPGLDQEATLEDAQAVISKVASVLMRSQLSYYRMPVIPRDANPPTDPNLAGFGA
jgi:hypothetical protein